MSIILIGLGASGVSFLTQLARTALELDQKNIRVKVISEKKYFGIGKAFGLANKIHLMNTPIETMGLDIFDENGYQRWIKNKNYPTVKFTERLQFSEYIQESYENLKTQNIIKIDEYKDKAIDINVNQKTNQISIYTSLGHTITGNYLVYAPGTINSNNFLDLIKYPSFINNPYQLDGVKKDSNIGILGSGLTATDVIRDLVNKGHKGKITLYSRKGLIPTCLTDQNVYKPTLFTFENFLNIKSLTNHLKINDLISLLTLEMKNFNSETKEANKLLNKNIAKYWDYLSKRASNADLPFQDTLISTRPFAYKIWAMLDENEKLLFSNRLSSYWACWRHPIPKNVIQGLIELVNFGQLHNKKIINMPYFTNNKFILNTTDGIHKEDYLINGTGGNHKLNYVEDMFLNSLIEKQLAHKNPLGGIKVDPNTFKIVNEYTPNMYAIGQIAKGSLFSTNAFWFNAKTASCIAKNLLSTHLSSISTINDFQRNNVEPRSFL